MIDNGTIDDFMRKHKLTIDKCPPYSLISSDTQCTYCVNCMKYCISQVKATKNGYKIGKHEYKKEEFDENR